MLRKNKINWLLVFFHFIGCHSSDVVAEKDVLDIAPTNMIAISTGLKVQEDFKDFIPVRFLDGLELVAADPKVDNTSKDRTVQFHNFKDGTITRSYVKSISVDSGYRAMYAYPGSEYFANVKIEKSVPGKFTADMATTIEHIRNYCDTKNAMAARIADLDLDNLPEDLEAHLKQLPNGKDEFLKVATLVKANNGKNITVHEGTRKKIAYIKCTETLLPRILGDNSIDIIHIFLREDEVIVTAYLLFQNNAKFKTIEEFEALDRNFLEGYVDFLVENRK